MSAGVVALIDRISPIMSSAGLLTTLVVSCFSLTTNNLSESTSCLISAGRIFRKWRCPHTKISSNDRKTGYHVRSSSSHSRLLPLNLTCIFGQMVLQRIFRVYRHVSLYHGKKPRLKSYICVVWSGFR